MTFTKPEILDAFHYAEVVHQKDAEELTKLWGDSLTIIDPLLKGKGDACYIIKEDDRVVVAFPGSNDWVDWVLNFYKTHEVEDGMHKGMKIGLDLMAKQIMSRLKALNPDKILITGVSRGGALADLFMELYGDVLIAADIDGITFAQPMVFTKDYYRGMVSMKDAQHVNYLRVYMANDVVKDLPFKKHGYTHRGDSLQIGHKLFWWQQAIQMWQAWKNEEGFVLAGIKEHDTVVYLKHLKEI